MGRVHGYADAAKEVSTGDAAGYPESHGHFLEGYDMMVHTALWSELRGACVGGRMAMLEYMHANSGQSGSSAVDMTMIMSN